MFSSTSIPQVTASYRKLPQIISPKSQEEYDSHPRKNAFGWLERELKHIRLKNGTIATYPKISGVIRDENDPRHWYWKYCWWERKERRKYLPQHEVYFVKQLIADEKSVQTILMHLSPSAAGKGGVR